MYLLVSNNEWLFLLCGVALATTALIVGIVLGVWASRRRGESSRNAREAQADGMLELMGALRSWTHGFAGDVSQFHERIHHLKQQLADSEPGSHVEADHTALELLTEMFEANERLKYQLDEAESSLEEKAQEVSAYLSEARTDGLTQVPNRRSFDDDVARRFSEWQRYRTEFSLLLIDIDHFKSFNDTHGHQAGDAVLIGVAKTLLEATRDSDQVARYGGEEFAAILPSSDIEDAKLVGQRVCAQVSAQTYQFEGKQFRVSVSVGAAQANGEDSLTTLIKRADAALYDAKESGRNRVHFHNGEHSMPAIPSDSPLATDPDVPPKLLQVCDDLRSKLIQFTRK